MFAKDSYLQSQKWCRVFSRGSTNCMTFSVWIFSAGFFYTLHDEKLVQDILEKGSTKKLLFV